MSPPIYTPDGSEVSEIVLPDGSTASEVIGPDGNVVFEAGPDIPDSVVHQYPYSTFTTSTWADNVGVADMTVNGMASATFSNGEDSVSGDGTDDYGLADGPEDLPTNSTFGFALTFQASADVGRFFGVNDGTDTHQFFCVIFNGEILFGVRENGNLLQVDSTNTYIDGNPHLVVVNKNGPDASDVEMYVDDMTTDEAVIDNDATGLDGSNYSTSQPDMAFYADNVGGTIENYSAFDAGIFEFNTAPYTQSERDALKSRRPEV